MPSISEQIAQLRSLLTDPESELYRAIFSQNLTLFVGAHEANDILRLLALKKEIQNGKWMNSDKYFKMTIIGGTEAWTVIFDFFHL